MLIPRVVIPFTLTKEGSAVPRFCLFGAGPSRNVAPPFEGGSFQPCTRRDAATDERARPNPWSAAARRRPLWAKLASPFRRLAEWRLLQLWSAVVVSDFEPAQRRRPVIIDSAAKPRAVVPLALRLWEGSGVSHASAFPACLTKEGRFCGRGTQQGICGRAGFPGSLWRSRLQPRHKRRREAPSTAQPLSQRVLAFARAAPGEESQPCPSGRKYCVPLTGWRSRRSSSSKS